MSELKLPAASGGGSISIKGPSSSAVDVDLLDTSGNLTVSGDIDLADSKKVKLGTGDDLEIYHSGSNTFFENTTGNIYFRNDGSATYFQMGSGNEDGIAIAKDDGVFLYFDGTQKFQTTSTGVTVTGNIAVPSGNGIDFSATANSGGTMSNELLDDYEEGTFTPRMGGTTNAGSYWVNGTGNYLKVGNICHVMIYFSNVDLDNSASGIIKFDTMPFASLNSSIVAGLSSNFHTYNVTFASDQRYTFYVSGNSTEWKGLISRNNNTWANWDVADFEASSTYVEFHGTYRTA